jgi:hypothetical protein
MRFAGHILIFTLFFVINENSSFSQDQKSFQIQKCARIESGFVLHFLSADEKNIVPGIAFQYCYGIKSSKKVGLGIGGGFQYFENESFVPVFLDVVYFLNQRKYTSFINLETGYAMGWSKNYSDYHNSSYKGGFNMGICFGKKIAMFSQFSMYLSAKYNLQIAKLEYENDQYQAQNQTLYYNMFIFSLGFMLEE